MFISSAAVCNTFCGAQVRYLALVETANAPIFGIGVDGRVNEWNVETARITGFAKDEAIGNPLGMYICTSRYFENPKRTKQ